MARILVVDDTPLIAELVKLTLNRDGHEIRTAENGLLGVAAAKEWRPDLIIMDVMMPELDGYDATRRIRQHRPTALIPIIILTAQDTVNEKIQGFEAGADDYLIKPFEPLELRMRVEVLLKRGQAASAAAKAAQDALKPRRDGHLIACFSLRGGVGVSTLATSLAVALAQIWDRPTALLDLVLSAGHAALLLNLSLKRTWADLARLEPDEYDAELVEGHLQAHPSGVRLLSSPLQSEDGDGVGGAHVTAALGFLRASHDYLVADLPHDFRETTLAVLDAAEVVVMPLAPDLASVRSAAAALGAFQSLGYSPAKIKLVLNWVFQKNGLPQGEIEKALKHKIDLVLPHDAENVVRAINVGQPLTAGTAGTAIGGLLEDYAFHLSRLEDTAGRPAAPTEAWQRVVKRLPKTSPAGKKGG